MGLMVSYVRCQVGCWLRKTFKDESGAAEVVATIVIIGIALTLALIFRKSLTNLVKNLWESLVQRHDNNASPTVDAFADNV